MVWYPLIISFSLVRTMIRYCFCLFLGDQQRANDLVEGYRDSLAKREELRQQRIERSQRFMNIVLSVFSPLAFITGVYGMNFVTPDGVPAIPELTWGFSPLNPADPDSPSVWNGSITGYVYFWLLSSTVTMCTLAMYKRMGLLESDFYKDSKKNGAKIMNHKPLMNGGGGGREDIANNRNLAVANRNKGVSGMNTRINRRDEI